MLSTFFNIRITLYCKDGINVYNNVYCAFRLDKHISEYELYFLYYCLIQNIKDTSSCFNFLIGS